MGHSNYRHLVPFFLLLLLLRPTQSKSTPAPTQPSAADLKLAQSNDLSPGCNLNVCFLLDASRHLTPREFTLLQNFVLDLLAVLAGNTVELSAATLGDGVTNVTGPTGSPVEFIEALVATRQDGSEDTPVAQGLRFCQGVLQERVGEAGKIVVLGSDGGIATLGLENVVENVRRDGLDVCVVSVGVKNPTIMELVAGGDADRVFRLNGFFQVADVVGELLQTMCGKRLLR